MSVKKRVIVLLLSALLTASCITGCGWNPVNRVYSLGKRSKEKTVITFFGNKADQANVIAIEEILSNFMQDNPDVIVTYESLKSPGYYTALSQRMKNGVGDDVFMVDHDIMLSLHANKQVVDLSDISSINTFTEATKSQIKSDDGIFWIPSKISAYGLYCNMDLLKKHGFSVPTNLNEWRTINDYFVSKGITPVIANNDLSLKTLAIGVSFSDEYNSGKTDELFNGLNDGSIKLGDALRDGFALVDEFIKKGYIDAKTTFTTEMTADDLELFAKGKTPFMLSGVWASDRVKNEFNATFAYKVHPLPILEDSSLIVVNYETRLSINANSKNIEIAKQFVEYFTRAENLQKFCEQQCSINPVKGGLSSTAAEIQPIIKCFLDERTVIGTDSRLNIPLWTVTRNASQSLLKGDDLDSVIKTLNSDTGSK